jgi:hypothetical protein
VLIGWFITPLRRLGSYFSQIRIRWEKCPEKRKGSKETAIEFSKHHLTEHPHFWKPNSCSFGQDTTRLLRNSYNSLRVQKSPSMDTNPTVCNTLTHHRRTNRIAIQQKRVLNDGWNEYTNRILRLKLADWKNRCDHIQWNVNNIKTATFNKKKQQRRMTR